jgi:hypothetical protein
MERASRQATTRRRIAETPLSVPSTETSSPSGDGPSLEHLREEYRRLYRSAAPKLSRDLLVRAIAYRRQEVEHGGLSKATRRKLQTIAGAIRSTGRVGPSPGLSLKPGARLVREWQGRTHTVTVTDDGFEYTGASYPSLTKIAKKITGAHWSGPRFFGLVGSGAAAASKARNDA